MIDLVPLPLLATTDGTLRSPHWEKVRHDFAVAHPTCAACGGNERLQVHHVRPFHLHPELELEPTNLITLCEHPERLCHHRIGHSLDWKAYNEHVREDAAQSLERIQKRLYQ